MKTAEKQCNKCEGIKPLADFNKHSTSKDGLQSYCRDCSKKEQKAWRDKQEKKVREVPKLIGEKYGRFTVIEEAGRLNNGRRAVLCECECGNRRTVDASSLTYGNTKSCGCLMREKAKIANTTHDMAGTRFYKIWTGILYRCDNPNATAYEHYGGRGIEVCERWRTFENFRDDMYAAYNEHSETYSEKNTSIDRIDTNGNYEPSNCRWATKVIQVNNRRRLSNNTSGATGVSWSKNMRKWTVYARIDGKRVHLGYFANKNDAIAHRKNYLAAQESERTAV